MKKFIIATLLFSVFSSNVFSQTLVQGTIVNLGSNSVGVYGMPNNNSISGLLFFNINITISIANQGTSNPAGSSIVATSNIPNLTVSADPSNPYIIGNRAYYSYVLNDNGSLTTTTWVANTSNLIATFVFPTDPTTLSVRLDDRSSGGIGDGGGPNFQMFWYVSVISGTVSNGIDAGDVTDYTSMFYGAGAVNNSANDTSFVPLQPPSLVPIKFINFNAIPQDNNAVLNWTVADEGTTSDYYKVERSTDDITFTAIDSVPVTDPEAASNTYSYIDQNISSIPSSSDVIYYRIEEFDQTGKVNYSTTQNIPLEANGLAAKVFPNPAKNSATLTFNLGVDKVVPVDIASADGKIIQTLQVQGIKGTNTQLIDLSSFSAGNYLVKLNTGAGIKTIGLVKTN